MIPVLVSNVQGGNDFFVTDAGEWEFFNSSYVCVSTTNSEVERILLDRYPEATHVYELRLA
jgi:hypothetical protein